MSDAESSKPSITRYLNDRGPGLYRHYKGGLYIVIGIVMEATNGQLRERKVLYYSIATNEFNCRRESEFWHTVVQTEEDPHEVPRFAFIASLALKLSATGDHQTHTIVL